MSSPRAATSEAIRSFSSPSRKACRIFIRSFWSRSPCSAAASKPCFFSDLASTSTSILRLQKMMPLVSASPSETISRRSTSRFSEAPVSLRRGVCLTTACRIVSEVVAWRATSTRTGLCRNSSVIRVISGAMVAEKNNVCRVKGTSLKMRSMSGMKPMSSIRSASSTTMMLTPVSISLPRSKWSSSRPGVAISTSTPRSISLSWSLKLTPPMSSAMESLTFFAYFSKFSATWAASSRVGQSTRLRGMRARARPLDRWWIIGSTKAAVLPVPVWAMPSTSRPSRALGIAWIWIGVGSVYPASMTADRTRGSSERSENVVMEPA